MIETMTFSDEKFLTAADKNKIFKAWQRFIQSGFTERAFSKSLYRYIIGHCGFIAHYNIGGFYATYFDELHDFKKFWNQFGGTHRMAEGYGPDFMRVMTWGAATALDLNQAMVAYAEQVNGTIMRAMQVYETHNRSGQFSTDLQTLIAEAFGGRTKNKARQQAKAKVQARQQKMQMTLF